MAWSPRRLASPPALGALAGALVIAAVGLVVTRGRGQPISPPITSPTESAITTPTIALIPPTEGSWLGAYVHFEDPKDVANLEAQVLTLNASLARPLDIDHHYIRWGALMAGDLARFDLQHGMIPMLSWQGIASTRIESGAEDEWIRTQARAVHALGLPVLIRYGWEMDIHPEWSGSPGEFVAAWRRIHAIFVQEGARNASWVWSPTSGGFATGQAQRFYPGEDAVDWIGADGYNWAPGRPGAAWRPFERIFRSFYAWAARSDKPLMIAETGTQERGPGEKAGWLADMAAAIRSNLPRIRAVVYFDSHARYDWRLETSPESFDAFRTIASAPPFDAPLGANVRQTPSAAPSSG
jgi:hypothetical protein